MDFGVRSCCVVLGRTVGQNSENDFLLETLVGVKDFSKSGGRHVRSVRAGDLTRIVTFLIGGSKDGMNKFGEGREDR